MLRAECRIRCSEFCQSYFWRVDGEVVGYGFEIRLFIGEYHLGGGSEKLVESFGDGDIGGEDEKFRRVQEDLPVGIVSQSGVCRFQIRSGAGIAGVCFDGHFYTIHI